MLWLRTLLTLLAMATSVLVAPQQTWASVIVPPLSDCLTGGFTQETIEPTILSSKLPAPDAVLKEHALVSEEKDEDPRVESIAGESRIFFTNCWYEHRVFDCLLISPRSVRSVYPLRC